MIERTFDAPRSLLFKAWTEPRRLAQWWGPKGFTNPVCEIDARPGGTLRIVMRSPDGAEHPMKGVFREVIEPERLVFTNIAIDTAGNSLIEGLMTVTFAEHAGKTKLILHTSVGHGRDGGGNDRRHGSGLEQSLDRLAEHLAKADPGGTIAMATNAKLSPTAGDILLIVGTVKGAFIFLSDRQRGDFKMSGPHFAGTISLVGGFYRQRRAANPRRQQE